MRGNAMSDALLDTLRELARRQSERTTQNADFPQSVESDYERNEKTHQLVERDDPGAPAVRPDEEGSSSDQIAKIAETLGFHRSPSRGPGYEINEINEKTLRCGDGVPPEWDNGLARLHPDSHPGDVPSGRWRQFVHDCGRLLDAGLIEEAARLGWTAHDLFGCDDERPFARVDQWGLVWLIKGGSIVSVSMSAAVIETPTGARQTYRRKDGAPGRVLAWELFNLSTNGA
jgi:hypothetical protein